MKKSKLIHLLVFGAAVLLTTGCTDDDTRCENVGTNGRTDGGICPDGYPYSCNGAEHCFQTDGACDASGECGQHYSLKSFHGICWILHILF